MNRPAVGLSTLALLVACPALGQLSDASQAAERDLRFDAATRVSLNADDAATTGHDAKGFYIGDGGANKLYIGGNMQFRYYANWRDNPTSPDSGFSNGFSFRRTRLAASGTVIDPKLSFALQIDFLTSGTATLYEAFADYKLTDSLTARWGQFKLPLLQEELNSFLRLQTIERSTLNTVFTQNYSQGVQLRHDSADIRLYGAFSDGLNTLNTDFANASVEADYALTGRAEWRWAGEWKQLDQFTSWKNAPYAGFLAGAVHFQNGGATAAPDATPAKSTPDRSVLEYTTDLSVKGNGWNVYAEFVGRHTDNHSANTTFDDFGLLISAGLFITDRAELFVRYDEVFPDSSYTTGSNDFTEITAGMNFYFVPESQCAKFTADVIWFVDDQAGSSALVKANPGSGLLASSKENQLALRFQMQLVF